MKNAKRTAIASVSIASTKTISLVCFGAMASSIAFAPPSRGQAFRSRRQNRTLEAFAVPRKKRVPFPQCIEELRIFVRTFFENRKASFRFGK